MADGARAAGLRRVASVRDVDEALPAVERHLAPGVGDLVLVKGSRGVELDRLVAALVGEPERHV
jgi:UDP-N-acetylmuramyl pentapeptide synthase